MTKRYSYLIWLINGLLLVISCQSLHANNLRIRNVSPDLTNGTVTFDITWDNSWNLETLGAPYHWDASWTFVKWRECNAPISDPWTHGLVDTSLAAHSFGSLEPTRSDGFSIGIDSIPFNHGAMLRRVTNGLFPTQPYQTVTLKLTNLPATGDYDVRVFGVEMVYVPRGEFLLGGTSETYPFNVGGQPVLVKNEGPIQIFWQSLNVTLTDSFPKGYNPFFCMKYEISQGQYCDFLNTLSGIAPNLLFVNQYNNDRNRVQSGGTPPDIYYSDRQDRANNYMNWTDLLAYLDWACLSPMTELQFEKVCRGNGPYVQNEYAWGSTDIAPITLLSTPEDGTEIAQNPGANCSYNNLTLTGGDGGRGPVRVGIFATATVTNKMEAGASYYGIMELSGNLWEQMVIATTQTDNFLFSGLWGDGYLDSLGYANVATWPFPNAINGVNNAYHSLRGGSWYHGTTRLRTSDRNYHYYGNNLRGSDFGGRGVR